MKLLMFKYLHKKGIEYGMQEIMNNSTWNEYHFKLLQMLCVRSISYLSSMMLLDTKHIIKSLHTQKILHRFFLENTPYRPSNMRYMYI